MLTSDSDPSGPMPARYALGVLWVHGIGEQEQGETLTQFGTPVVEWITRWLAPDAGKPVRGVARVERAHLHDPGLDDGAPAHATLSLRVASGDDAECQQEWLFAEGWWGTQVIEPKLRPFLAWLVTRGPWVLLFHLHQCLLLRSWFRQDSTLGRLLGRASGSILWRLLAVAAKGLVVLVLWNLLSLLLVALWLGVSVLALVPIGRLRSAVLSLMKKVASVVGDSFVLVRDASQRAALSSAVLDALCWLQRRCARVAVVAHSQGAAVAHDALATRGAPKIDTLVTVGAGLVKLQALLHAEQHFPQRFLFAGLVAPVLAASTVIGTRLYFLDEPAGYLWLAAVILLLVGLLSVVFVWESVSETLSALRSRAPQLALSDTQPELRWRDYFATHDPVPNGSLSNAIPVPGLRSAAVSVRGSLWADHTAYWSSRADFVPRLLAELARCAQLPMLAVADVPATLAEARRRLRRRLPILSRVRWGDWLVVLTPCLVVAERVAGAVGELRGLLSDLPFDLINKILGGLDAALAWLIRHLFGIALAHPAFWVNLALSFAALMLLLSLWRAVFLAVWGWWADLDLDDVFTPSKPTVHGLTRFLVDQFVGVLAALPLFVAVIWTWYPEYLTEVLAYAVLAIVGGGLIVLMTVMVALNVFRDLLAEWREKRAARAAAGAIESLEQMISVFAVLVAVLVAIAALFAGWSIWATAGATIAFGGAAAFVVGAFAHYANHVQLRRAGDARAPAAGRALLIAPPAVAVILIVPFAWYSMWWMGLAVGALVFAGIVTVLRPGKKPPSGAAPDPPRPS